MAGLAHLGIGFALKWAAPKIPVLTLAGIAAYAVFKISQKRGGA